MSTYSTIQQLEKMLENMLGWLDRASDHAKAKNFEVDGLLVSRLAPDQYSLVRQVQAACDAAKFAAARLAGKEAPKHPDTEKTVDELRTRVRSVVEYMKGFKESDFAGGDARMIPISFMPGKGLLGIDYLDEFAVPNFYFHVTTAYSILRHNGVDLGKSNYMGAWRLKDI